MLKRIVSLMVVLMLIGLALTGSGASFKTDVLLIVDRSGSMNDPMPAGVSGKSKFTLITESGGLLETALNTLEAKLTDDSQITFWAFGGGCSSANVNVLVDWEDKAEAIQDIRGAQPGAGGFPQGRTPLDEVIRKLSDEIKSRLSERPGFLIGYMLLSDGIPTCCYGSPATSDEEAKECTLSTAKNSFGNAPQIKEAIDMARLKGTLVFPVPKYLGSSSTMDVLASRGYLGSSSIGEVLVSRGYADLGQGRYYLPASATVHYASMPQAPTPELAFAEALAGEMMADLLVAETEEEFMAATVQGISGTADPSFPPRPMRICGVKNLGGIINISAIVDDRKTILSRNNENGIIDPGEYVNIQFAVDNIWDETWESISIEVVEVVPVGHFVFSYELYGGEYLGDLPPYGRLWTDNDHFALIQTGIWEPGTPFARILIAVSSPDFGTGAVEFTLTIGAACL